MLQSLLKIQLIDIVSLDSSEPRSGFSKQKIDELAENFIQIGGNSHPILVERLDVDSFQVVLGHLEYYAAVRAREINDDFEMINAIILIPENKQQVIEQYQSLLTTSLFSDNSDQGKSTSPALDKEAIATLEKNLLAHIQDQLKFQIGKLEANLSKGLDEKFDRVKILVPRDQDHLAVFNNADLKELINKLKPAGITGKRAKNTANAILLERKKGQFNSFSEVIERIRLKDKRHSRAITESTMIKILDSWNGWLKL